MLADSIDTQYVKGGYATANEVVLSETPKTRTLFRPGLHSKGVRGDLIRQKRGADGSWVRTNEVNFTKVPPDCGVSIELDTEATTKLLDKLMQLHEVQKKGIELGSTRFVVGKEDEVLLVDSDSKGRAIKELLDEGYSEEFWNSLADKEPDLASRLAVAKLHLDRCAVIREFEASLKSHRSDEDFWQGFFGENPWIIEAAFSAAVFILNGETYLGGKLPIGRSGKGGVATDFLGGEASTKSFNVVDVKTPGADLVGRLYRGDRGSGLDNEVYSISPGLSGAIVQVRNQIAVAVENFTHTLGRGFAELNRVHPKGVLITGLVSELDERQQFSLNQFRYGLFSLTVITYDELLRRLKILFADPPEDSQDGEEIDPGSAEDDEIPW
jgi:Domain of unknown function (DUF4263)